MPSTFSWIVHDKEMLNTVRELLKPDQKESRDELGLGPVRDSFADQLFPGTSTGQTRLRYMLFIPWIYRSLEQKRLGAEELAEEAKKQQTRLAAALGEANEKGIIGRDSGEDLKRLPSEIYWRGLGVWGIRIDESYNGEEGGGNSSIWHEDLPKKPRKFPQKANFSLTRAEAEFILERLDKSCGESLLYTLACRCRRARPADVNGPWELNPRGFSADQKALLSHARLFSKVMHGAMLSYNFQLAQLAKNSDWADDYEKRFTEWAEEVKKWNELLSWDLDELWNKTEGYGHDIKPAKDFVESWVAEVRNMIKGKLSIKALLVDERIKEREKACKGNSSRFINKDALDQWRGESMTRPFDYRWSRVKIFLEDLYDGFQEGGK